MPIVMVDAGERLIYGNQAAEQFFDMGVGLLLKQTLADLLPFGSPLLQLVQQTRERGASVAERNVDLSDAAAGRAPCRRDT
jgi:two-component system nitrogen regulation sensor histidine kinase GlnL